jgi:hypothetical protein
VITSQKHPVSDLQRGIKRNRILERELLSTQTLPLLRLAAATVSAGFIHGILLSYKREGTSHSKVMLNPSASQPVHLQHHDRAIPITSPLHPCGYRVITRVQSMWTKNCLKQVLAPVHLTLRQIFQCFLIQLAITLIQLTATLILLFLEGICSAKQPLFEVSHRTLAHHLQTCGKKRPLVLTNQV